MDDYGVDGDDGDYVEDCEDVEDGGGDDDGADDGDDVKDGEILGEYCENLNSGPLAGDREPADEN